MLYASILSLSLHAISNSPKSLDLMRFYSCIKTGLENPTSKLGCYATSASDYSDFKEFFDNLIRDYHGDFKKEKKHCTNWETHGEEYNVGSFGMDELSVRIRVGRNFEGFALPAGMTKDMRVDFEKKMLPVFGKLKERFGGTYYSLSPDLGQNKANPNLISDEKYKSLVDEHIMFKDMSQDTYLNSAGISSDWPFGRGCWQSEDKTRVIWVGEEDHMRIMCMKTDKNLLEVFNCLKDMLVFIENIEGINFAMHDDYGYVTSCPSNLGTGMRASVHLKMGKLAVDDSSLILQNMCKHLGLSGRGTRGEHTEIVDGTVDVSPLSCVFTPDKDILSTLFTVIKSIIQIESKIAENLQFNENGEVHETTPNTCAVEEECVKVARKNMESLKIGRTLFADKEVCVVVGEQNHQQHEKESNRVNSRNDKGEIEHVNFVLVDNTKRDEEEKEKVAADIENMKQLVKSLKVSILDRLMAVQSLRSLNMSPSPILAITDTRFLFILDK